MFKTANVFNLFSIYHSRGVTSHNVNRSVSCIGKVTEVTVSPLLLLSGP